MKKHKLLFIIFLGIFLSYCSSNIDETLTNEIEKIEEKYIINDDFLVNEKLSENEVRFVAATFTSNNSLFSSNKKTRNATDLEVSSIFPLISEKGQTLAYAVNFKGGGYNIVSATQKYAPIIGFAEEGSIEQGSAEENPSFAFWMDYIKGDILCQMNKKDESDSIAIKNRILWREYEGSALAKSSTPRATTKDHRYWYNQERNNAMNRPFNSSSTLCSADLQRFIDIVRTDYENRNNLSDSEKERLRMVNTALQSEYTRAGLWAPAASFWSEFHNSTTVYDTGNLVKTYWRQGHPYNLFNPYKDVPPTGSNSDKRQPMGCVTIAVSQILNYHKHPQKLYRTNELLAIVEEIRIDWNKTDIAFYNDTTKLEIPRFLKFVNQGVFTENGDLGSSSTIHKAKVFLDLNQYSTQLYEGLYVEGMISEVKAGRPCYVRGNDSNNEGHAFICDGYKAAKRQLSIELTTTNETSVKDYFTNPYFLYKSSQGSRIMSEEYLSFNWGWGGYPTWVIKPSNSPMDLGGFNNNNKVLTIKKI